MGGLRDLPAVDRLAAELDASHPLAVAAARAVIEERRRELLSGAADEPDLVARARERLELSASPSLRRVLNATGVIVHTNLGRAPLPAAAREAVTRAAEGSQPRVGPRAGRARLAPRPRRGAAVRADGV